MTLWYQVTHKLPVMMTNINHEVLSSWESKPSVNKKQLVTDLSQIDGLVQEICNSSALAMELCLSCTNPSKYSLIDCCNVISMG